MLKRLIAIAAALIIMFTVTGIPAVFAENAEISGTNDIQADIFVLTSIPGSPFQIETVVGTAFEDTDAADIHALTRLSAFADGPNGNVRIFLTILSWDISAYNPNTPGVYTLHGEIDFSVFTSGVIENPNNLRPAIIMTVLEPQIPVIDEENIRRGWWHDSGVWHWGDMLTFPVKRLYPWAGCDVTVWQSDDDGNTWFDISGSNGLLVETDGFRLSGLEEGRVYGFKIEVNGNDILQGMSEPVYVTLDENYKNGYIIGGCRTGRRPDGTNVLPPVNSGNDNPESAPVTILLAEPAVLPLPTPAAEPAASPLLEPIVSPIPTPAVSYIPEPEDTPLPIAAPESAIWPDLLNDYNISNGTVMLESYTLPVAEWKRFAEAGLSVTFTLPLGTLTLDPDAVKSTVAAASGPYITASFTQAINLTEAQQESVNPDDLVFKITMVSGTQHISNFDGYITITVPYYGNMPVVVWYLSDDGVLDGVWYRYDTIERTVSFMTNHLSLYVVAPITESYPNNWMAVLITGIISIIIAGAFFILWRKREMM
ncbi:MAG: hypothetical protein FWE14_06190 [Lachnospiraceae bacterium]|nr:hypothetical protein [Lachnospiraceae bacterium]